MIKTGEKKQLINDDVFHEKRKKVSSMRWDMVSLSLSMLLSSLGTSIANVALPTLAQTFTASFQAVAFEFD